MVNKKWKIGGDVHVPMENKLKFLYENGREEQVAMYLRNQNISDDSFDEQYKKRVECEMIHRHIKSTLNSITEAGETRVKNSTIS